MEPHTYHYYEARNVGLLKKPTFERVGAAQGASQLGAAYRSHLSLPCGCEAVSMCGHCCGRTGPCRNPEAHFLADAWVLYVSEQGRECTTHVQGMYFGVSPTPEQVAIFRQVERRRVLDIARQVLGRL